MIQLWELFLVIYGCNMCGNFTWSTIFKGAFQAISMSEKCCAKNLGEKNPNRKLYTITTYEMNNTESIPDSMLCVNI